MILLIMLLSEIASIAIYIIMSTQNAFGEVLPKWKGEWDVRGSSVCRMVPGSVFCMADVEMDQEKRRARGGKTWKD